MAGGCALPGHYGASDGGSGFFECSDSIDAGSGQPRHFAFDCRNHARRLDFPLAEVWQARRGG
jgi:hypothetical protein